jgi:hypothetical protein
MRFSLLISSFVISTLPGTALAGGTQDLSWGKAGVPLAQYASDAGECADTSRMVAVYIKPDTVRKLDAFSSTALFDIALQISSAPDFNPMTFTAGMTGDKTTEGIARRTNTFGAKYVAMAQSDVRDELQSVLDKCLRERGYVQIRLTPDQQKALSRLKRHSAERTRYLHAIDADPHVIAQQRVIAAP